MPDDSLFKFGRDPARIGMPLGKGMWAEKDDRLPEAIAAYMLHVQAGYIGSYPYRRLRVIYSKQKRYAEAAEVCRAFIRARRDEKQRPDTDPKVKRFREWAEKLDKKVAAEGSGNE